MADLNKGVSVKCPKCGVIAQMGFVSRTTPRPDVTEWALGCPVCHAGHHLCWVSDGLELQKVVLAKATGATRDRLLAEYQKQFATLQKDMAWNNPPITP